MFLLGGMAGVAESVAQELQRSHPGLTVQGTDGGRFDRDGDSDQGDALRERKVEHPSRFRPRGIDNPRRIALDGHGTSTLTLRLRSTSPLTRMPPLGVQVVDDEGVSLVERWIAETQTQHHAQETRP